MFLSLFVPFEFIYLWLYDIFHSIPKYGYPVFTSYGWWLDFPMNIIKSLMFVDGFFVIGSVYVMCYIRYEMKINKLNESLKFINFNKISKMLLLGYIITTMLWILMPVYTNVEFEWGTKYFPQTIYPKYGYYKDYNITHPNNETYGIVYEYWVPNDLVKIWNHTSKAFSVAFMFYTFTPRRKRLKA